MVVSDMFSQEEITVFFDELQEKIDVISQGLLELEEKGLDLELVNEIFRAAHTIKGSSGIMGFEKMANLTHEMENVLDQLRNEKLEVSSDLVTVLFACLDSIKTLQDEMQNGKEKTNVDALIGKLHSLLDNSGNVQSEAKEESIEETVSIGDFTSEEIQYIKENELKGLQPYVVRIYLEFDCMMKSIRAFLLFDALAGIGKVFRTIPQRDALDDETMGNEIVAVVLSSQGPDDIKNLVNTIPDVFSVKVDDLMLEETSKEESDENSKEIVEEANDQELEDNSIMDRVEKSVAQTVRVDVRKLDTLMNLVGEMVIDRTRLSQLSNTLENQYGTEGYVGVLGEISTHLARVTTELQEEIMKARMLPIAQVFNKFPRMVRDLAQKFGKDIHLNVEGKETELDRTVIEVINDPLIHLVRNAVDHGIELPTDRVNAGKPETGTLSLRAKYQENHIIIEVEDDGKGISGEKIKQSALKKGLISEEKASKMSVKEAVDLIFLPGFSTSSTISDISGRGVGMDVVRRKIEEVNGIVEIISEEGKGTKFVIKLPLTLAIIQSLLVGSGEEVYAFPLANVLETFRINIKEIQKIKGYEVVLVRERLLPLLRLRQLFDGEVVDNEENVYVVIIGLAEKRIGFIVDDFIGEQEIVIKSLGDYLGRVPGFAGATILGDGKVALIVDARSLINDLSIDM